MKSRLLGAVCACVTYANVISPSSAALVPKLGGLVVYDDDRDITWLADANYAFTSGYIDTIPTENGDGRMTHAQAVAWADQLNFVGEGGWRLPTNPFVDDTCNLQATSGDLSYSYGSYCTSGEMGHLYYEELSGTIDHPISESGDPDLDLFVNIHDSTSVNYWSSQVQPWGEPYGFHFLNGGTNYGSDTNQWYAWAVHDGDIVPIPSALYLFASGLIGLVGVAKRRATGVDC